MPGDISDRELFWNTVTRQRMGEVGSDRPFDLMVRGKYNSRIEDVDPLKIGPEAGVEADMISFDLDSCYFRVYNVEFSPVSAGIGGDIFPEEWKLSDVVEGLRENWGYESSTLVFDNEDEYGEKEAILEGTVYWPESASYDRDTVYEDVVDMLEEDILSEL